MTGDVPKFLRIAFIALLLFMPVATHAANNCPWMNESTASGLVGGDTIGEFVVTPGHPSVCTFTQRRSNVRRILQIGVEIAADPHARLLSLGKACGTSTEPLSAIGNEAFVCAIHPGEKTLRQVAIGRVRDQIFTISLSTSLRNDNDLNKDELRIKIGLALEQVAGNLF